MSDTFQEREKGFERKFQLDQELQFKVNAVRDKLFGHWLAEKLGLTGASADQYAKDVVVANLDKPGDDDLMAKVRRDLDGRNVVISDKELRYKLEELQALAARKVMGEN
ncbi:MAG: DUF1476 domain-containing protein [Rhodospirillaceae bacterium]|nr:DUF1476 domain-containing protein [Rhodospirillaceae bacterium]